MKLGLVGFACPTGLGHLNLRFWNHLPFDRWLVVPHPKHGVTELGNARPGIFFQMADLHKFLSGLDVVVALERTFPSHLFALTEGTKRVLFVDHEWIAPNKDWFTKADVLVAWTHCGYQQLHEAGFGSKTLFSPAPIAVDEFPFRVREKASRFVFTNGWGGVYDRKGWPQIRELLQRDPTYLHVFSQRPIDVPPGVSWAPATTKPSDLYSGFDVAVQPSRFEGLGLSILEALASGLPVLTTNEDPMREHIQGAFGLEASRFLVRVARQETTRLFRVQKAAIVDVDDLEQKVLALRGQSLQDLSLRARQYVEEVHGDTAWEKLLSILQK